MTSVTKIFISLCCFMMPFRAVYCQQFTSASDLRSYFLNLPLLENKDSLIKSAKKIVRNNSIDSFTIITNTRVYILDSAIEYNLFSIKPQFIVLTMLDFWSYDNPQEKDTTFIISIEGFYGTTSKAEDNMFSEFENVKDIFEGQFYRDDIQVILATENFKPLF